MNPQGNRPRRAIASRSPARPAPAQRRQFRRRGGRVCTDQIGRAASSRKVGRYLGRHRVTKNRGQIPMNQPNHSPVATLLLTALLKAAPFLKPEYAETVAAAVAWLSIHLSTYIYARRAPRQRPDFAPSPTGGLPPEIRARRWTYTGFQNGSCAQFAGNPNVDSGTAGCVAKRVLRRRCQPVPGETTWTSSKRTTARA